VTHINLLESRHASCLHLLLAGVPRCDGVHSSGTDGAEPGSGGPSSGHVGHAFVVRRRVCVAPDVGLRSWRSLGARGEPGEELPILKKMGH